MLSFRKTKSLSLVLSTLLIISCSNSSNSSSNMTSTPSPTGSLDEATFIFKSECDLDPFLTGEMKQMELDLKKITCPPTLRYSIKDLPQEIPKSIQTPREELLDPKQCDLKRFNKDWMSAEEAGEHLFPNLVIQIVPFQTPDFPATGDPVKELSTWWNFVRDGLDGMTDVDSKYEIRIADQYFKIDQSLASYRLGNQSPDDNQPRIDIAKDIMKVADKSIDFTGVNKIFFVGPPGTNKDQIQNWGGPNQVKTDEGNLLPGIYITGHPSTIKEGSTNVRGPMGEIHELMHLMNATLFDHDSALTGGFGNMSGAVNDFLAWDKLIAKFIDLEQIRCAPTDKTTIHWIKPSTINGKHEKLLMIPLSDHEAIAVESIRNSGFNYKLAKFRLGALVYTLDTKKLDVQINGMDGVEVIGDPKTKYTKGPYLQGDSIEIKGFKITILESGEFGDVVQVEPVN